MVACAALLLFAGCSAIRIGYSQADNILAWTANDYFDLDPQQKHELGARIDRLLQWHRYEQLPEYAQFFTEVKQRAQRPLTRDDAVWLVEGVKERYRTLVKHGVNDAADMLASLTPDNIQALQKQWDKVNRKFVREHKIGGTPEERKRARLERTLKNIRDWTGSLTLEQETRIAALSNALPDTEVLRHQDRQRRQREFLGLLKLRNNKPEFLPLLEAWLLNWERGRTPETDRMLNEGYEKRIALYLEMDRLLTPQQRTHMLHRVQDYIDDMQALAKRRTAPQ